MRWRAQDRQHQRHRSEVRNRVRIGRDRKMMLRRSNKANRRAIESFVLE